MNETPITFKTYQKINGLWKRYSNKTPIPNQFSLSVFKDFYFSNFPLYAQEKINGTNSRICFDIPNKKSYVYGKSNNSMFSPSELRFLDGIVLEMEEYIYKTFATAKTVIVFGELYGWNIQGNSYGFNEGVYDFHPFDIMVNGIYLEVDDLVEHLNGMGVTYPGFNVLTLPESFIYLSEKSETRYIEGVVLRPKYNLYLQNGDRVVMKVKTEDLKYLKVF